MNARSHSILKEAFRTANLRGVFVHFQSMFHNKNDTAEAFDHAQELLQGLRALAIPNDFLIDMEENEGPRINLKNAPNWDSFLQPKTVLPMPTDSAFNYDGDICSFSSTLTHRYNAPKRLVTIMAGVSSTICFKGSIVSMLKQTRAHVFVANDATEDQPDPENFKRFLSRKIPQKKAARLHVAPTEEILESLNSACYDFS